MRWLSDCQHSVLFYRLEPILTVPLQGFVSQRWEYDQDNVNN